MIRNIHIKPVLNGFVVTVGCQELVYASTSALLFDLGDYFGNPEQTEARILKGAIHRKHTLLGDRPVDPQMDGGTAVLASGWADPSSRPQTAGDFPGNRTVASAAHSL